MALRPARCVAAFLLLLVTANAGRNLRQIDDLELLRRPPTIDGVAWSSSGMLGVWQAGVMHALLRAGVLDWGSDPGMNYAGTGEGAIVAISGIAGHNPQRTRTAFEASMQTAVNEARACRRSNGTNCDALSGKYEAFITRVLNTLIRETTAGAANSTMTVHLSLVPAATESRPLTAPACNSLSVEANATSVFFNRTDVISALLASTHYPAFSSPNCTRTFRGHQYKNGALTLPMPCPAGSNSCLRISAVPPSVARRLGWGITDANALQPDIFPGSSGAPLPIPESQWSNAMWDPEAVLPVVNALYSLGFTDGRSWARDNFFVLS
uniref:Phospholipase B-like n=1 Tax=Chlamydomonas leiostraca TaxID=1034604 RepID=A0A7S0WYI4_9CHLO